MLFEIRTEMEVEVTNAVTSGPLVELLVTSSGNGILQAMGVEVIEVGTTGRPVAEPVRTLLPTGRSAGFV